MNNNNKWRHQESVASSSSPARRRSCNACKYFGNQCKEDCLFAKYLRLESQTFNSIMQKFPPEKHQMVLLALFLCYKWILKIPTGNRYRVLESLVGDITASNSTTVDEMNQVLRYNVQRQPQPQPLPHIHQYSAQPRGGSGINRGQPNTTPSRRGSSSGVNLGQASGSRGINNPGHQAITNNPGVGGVGLPLCVVEFNNLLYRHGMINQYYTQQLQPMPRGIHTDQANTSSSSSSSSSNPNVNLTSINNDLFDEDEYLLHPALRLAPHHEILQPTIIRSSSHSTQTSDSNLCIDLNEDITRQAKDAPQGPNPKP